MCGSGFSQVAETTPFAGSVGVFWVDVRSPSRYLGSPLSSYTKVCKF